MAKITPNTLRKLNLYRQSPDIVQPLTNAELADLVVIVLGQVAVIETAIREGRLDGITPQAGKDYLGKPEALTMLTNAVNDAVRDFDGKMSQRGSQLEIQVLKALENIRSGDDGIVSEAEIQRAAEMAFGLLELPDFAAMIKEATTTDVTAIRDGLEILVGDNRLQLEITDVKGLEDSLQKLAQVKASTGGGGIGKNQVYNFIREAIADGTISAGGGGGGGDLLAANNLSDLANATTARTNLGLGTAAQSATGAFATAAQGTLAGSAVQPAGLTPYQLISAKDAVNGYAGLDAGGKINPSQLPALAITDTFVVASQAAMLALTAEIGDLAVRTDINQTFILRVAGASTLANWTQFLTPTDTVTSVFSRSGPVTAQNGDYNTSQVTENTNLYHTVARVRDTLLAGISFAVSTAVVAGDSILVAIGKLQAQSTINTAKVSADATSVASINAAATSKATPVGADSFPIVNSAAANAIGRVTFTNLMTFIGSFVQTVTGKRNQPRTNSTTTAATLAPDLTVANVYFRTTQTATLTISAPIGTPVIGETLYIEVSSVASQTLTINAIYIPFGAAFPAATTAGKSFLLTCTFNGTNWRSTGANEI